MSGKNPTVIFMNGKNPTLKNKLSLKCVAGVEDGVVQLRHGVRLGYRGGGRFFLFFFFFFFF